MRVGRVSLNTVLLLCCRKQSTQLDARPAPNIEGNTMFDIRQNPHIPQWAVGLIRLGPLLVVLLLGVAVGCAVTKALAGCNSIPEVVCVSLNNPPECLEQLDAAREEAAESGKDVEVPSLGLIVRPTGHMVLQ